MTVTPCSGNHKQRLFVGEGNFSFTEAFIQKHDAKWGHAPTQSLGRSIWATELQPPDSLNGNGEATARIDRLKEKGVFILFGVDGAALHAEQTLDGKKFPRIHWNCPHDGSQYQKQSLPPIIEAFFQSCRKMQSPQDRVHITLAQPTPPPSKPKNLKEFYQGMIYDIVRASTLAGYKLIKKRVFGQERYPEYHHTQTVTSAEAPVIKQGMREFVFEQIPDDLFTSTMKKILCSVTEQKDHAQINACTKPNDLRSIFDRCGEEKRNTTVSILAEETSQTSSKKISICKGTFGGHTRCYFYCSSDNDSSDGEK